MQARVDSHARALPDMPGALDQYALACLAPAWHWLTD